MNFVVNTRVYSAIAAVVLSASTIASPALVQIYTAPAGIPALTAPGGLEGRSYTTITTGSIGYSRGYDSALEGNANQQNFPVQQYGQTSGGPGL